MHRFSDYDGVGLASSVLTVSRHSLDMATFQVLHSAHPCADVNTTAAPKPTEQARCIDLEWGKPALDLFDQGKLPEEVLAELLKGDEQRDKRQLAIIDLRGRAANRNPADSDMLAGGTGMR